MGQQAGRVPAVCAELIARPLHGFIPLLREVAGIGGMRQLDADSGVIAVAHVPAQTVLWHRVVYGGTIELHDVMDGVGIIAAPQERVIVRARARIRGLVDYEVGRIEIAVAARYVLVDALVGFCAARGSESRNKGENDGKDATKRQLALSLGHSLHLLSGGRHRPPAQRRRR